MRTNEERIAAMHERAGQLEKEKRRKKTRLAGMLGIVVCLALAVVLAVLISGTEVIVSPETGSGSMTASIFSGSGALKSIVIGIIAFLLGVSATVFCFRLKKRSDRRDNEDS